MINYLRIGIITSIFGIKGEVKVISTTDDKQRFKLLDSVYVISSDNYDLLNTELNKYEKRIIDVKFLKDKIVIKFKDIDTIEQAQKLINKDIYIRRADAVKLTKDEYYLADIIDIDLVLVDKCISKVKDVLFTGSNANLVADYNEKELLIPMTKDYIDNIDIKNNKIYLKNIDGLFDL